MYTSKNEKRDSLAVRDPRNGKPEGPGIETMTNDIK